MVGHAQLPSTGAFADPVSVRADRKLVREVVEELWPAGGPTLRIAKELSERKLIALVRGRPTGEALNRIAETLGLRWVQLDDAYELREDPRQRALAFAAVRAAETERRTDWSEQLAILRKLAGRPHQEILAEAKQLRERLETLNRDKPPHWTEEVPALASQLAQLEPALSPEGNLFSRALCAASDRLRSSASFQIPLDDDGGQAVFRYTPELDEVQVMISAGGLRFSRSLSGSDALLGETEWDVAARAWGGDLWTSKLSMDRWHPSGPIRSAFEFWDLVQQAADRDVIIEAFQTPFFDDGAGRPERAEQWLRQICVAERLDDGWLLARPRRAPLLRGTDPPELALRTLLADTTANLDTAAWFLSQLNPRQVARLEAGTVYLPFSTAEAAAFAPIATVWTKLTPEQKQILLSRQPLAATRLSDGARTALYRALEQELFRSYSRLEAFEQTFRRQPELLTLFLDTDTMAATTVQDGPTDVTSTPDQLANPNQASGRTVRKYSLYVGTQVKDSASFTLTLGAKPR